MARYGFDYGPRDYRGFGGGGFRRGYDSSLPGGYGAGPDDFGRDRATFQPPQLSYGEQQRWDPFERDPSFGQASRGQTAETGRRSGGSWGPRGEEVAQARAREIMTENPEAVTPDTPLAEVAVLMRDLDVGIMPVVSNRDSYKLDGVITDRDIAIRAAADGEDMKKATAGKFMSTEVATVRENATVREVFDVMKRERVRRVPVTDGSGRLVGIIAQADLAVDYAGLEPEREMEVEEVIERISEPARPGFGGRGNWREWGPRPYQYTARGPRYDRDFSDRLRHGWRTLKEEARGLVGSGYDRGWR